MPGGQTRSDGVRETFSSILSLLLSPRADLLVFTGESRLATVRSPIHETSAQKTLACIAQAAIGNRSVTATRCSYLSFDSRFDCLFHIAPSGMQITAPNSKNQIAPWWPGLPGKHANRLSAARPRTIGGVCTSGCIYGGFRRFVSVVFSFASSLPMHRQGTVRVSSGILSHGQFYVALTGAHFGCMIFTIKALYRSA